MSDDRPAWLVKSEPSVFSFADLWAAPDRRTVWDGVRNYQARNYLRDQMWVGDVVVFYHSNADPAGVAGLAEVASDPFPDPSQFDPGSPYHDAASDPANPRWWSVEVHATRYLPRFVPLAELRTDARLAAFDLPLLRRGNRLSVMPVPAGALARIAELAAG